MADLVTTYGGGGFAVQAEDVLELHIHGTNAGNVGILLGLGGGCVAESKVA
nr:hypothetical protein [Alcanivorax sp. UBA3183]|tara:strand:+ start:3962 stop:4114 length:153 start_codon:yes stop_codon:yes gene_type:complete